jgi:sec-independent protein translocase protein TatB
VFDIGFSEILLLAAIALIVLGPEKLPHAARMAGAWYGRIRRTIGTIQSEIEQEVNALEVRQRMETELAKIREAEAELRAEMNRIHAGIADISKGSTTPARPQDPSQRFYFLLRGDELAMRQPPAPWLPRTDKGFA